MAKVELRHLQKWYDRLEEICKGTTSGHPNFYSDPTSVGLVAGTQKNAKLTAAGKSFYNSRSLGHDNSYKAEYYLMRSLYFENHKHNSKAKMFLDSRLAHMYHFLSICSPTPNKNLLIEKPKLLTIAEYITKYKSALLKFMQLEPETLTKLEALGEKGFQTLIKKDVPKGICRICRKIGGDYTRASNRRRDMIFSIAILTIRNSLLRSGKYFDRLQVPYPFCNLISEIDIANYAHLYTNEVEIVQDGLGFLALVKTITLSKAPKIEIEKFSFKRKNAKKVKIKKATKPSVARKPITKIHFFDSATGNQAETYLAKNILSKEYGKKLIRIGHTDLESRVLSDGLIVGSDFLVGSFEKPELFIEVKSTKNFPPRRIQVTSNEYLRAKKCLNDKIKYILYILAFDDPQSCPRIYKNEEFAQEADSLQIIDLISLEIPIHI